MDYNKLKSIDTFIFDVDGVLTNSQILVTEEGHLLRSMNVRDGMAIIKAIEAGYKVAIITKGNSKGVKIRLENLGVHPILDGVKDKAKALMILQSKYHITPQTSLYMGDDLADIVVFDKVLLACCPHDSAPEVIGSAEFISPVKGGHGCVRDIIERVMRIAEKWS